MTLMIPRLLSYRHQCDTTAVVIQQLMQLQYRDRYDADGKIAVVPQVMSPRALYCHDHRDATTALTYYDRCDATISVMLGLQS